MMFGLAIVGVALAIFPTLASAQVSYTNKTVTNPKKGSTYTYDNITCNASVVTQNATDPSQIVGDIRAFPYYNTTPPQPFGGTQFSSTLSSTSSGSGGTVSCSGTGKVTLSNQPTAPTQIFIRFKGYSGPGSSTVLTTWDSPVFTVQ